MAAKGWTNVHVVEGDACTFQPPQTASLVTFSYSLSSTLLAIAEMTLLRSRECSTGMNRFAACHLSVQLLHLAAPSPAPSSVRCPLWI